MAWHDVVLDASTRRSSIPAIWGGRTSGKHSFFCWTASQVIHHSYLAIVLKEDRLGYSFACSVICMPTFHFSCWMLHQFLFVSSFVWLGLPFLSDTSSQHVLASLPESDLQAIPSLLLTTGLLTVGLLVFVVGHLKAIVYVLLWLLVCYLPLYKQSESLSSLVAHETKYILLP